MEKGAAERTVSAIVNAVQNAVKLTEEILATLEANPGKLNLSAGKKRWHKQCLGFVEFENVKSVTMPLAFDHQSNMDDRLIFDKIEAVIVGTSIPYNDGHPSF